MLTEKIPSSAQKKIVLSVLCDGTNYNTQHQSIIGELEQDIAAQSLNKGGRYCSPKVDSHANEQHYKIYVPGPAASPNEDYARPGTINPITGQAKHHNKDYQQAKPNAEIYQEAYGLHLPAVGSSPTAILNALVTGTGLRDNVLHVLDCVAELISDPNVDWANSDISIQFVGWSRGAITAGIIANMLTQSFIGPHAKVTVIQIDPVGGDDFCEREENKDCKGIGENVVNHLSILAMDDPRKRFKALEQADVLAELATDDARKSIHKVIPLHGSHASVAKGDSPSAKIARQLISQNFSASGVKFHATAERFQHKTAADLIELYVLSKLQQQQHAYKFNPITRLIYGIEQRLFLETHDQDMRLPQYFVNSRHEQLLKDNYPELFAYLANPKVTKQELDKAKEVMPTGLFAELQTTYDLQELDKLKALEILVALGKCKSFLMNAEPALSQLVQEQILQTFKQDYMIANAEKSLIEGLHSACSDYISLAKTEITELEQKITTLKQTAVDKTPQQEKQLAKLEHSRDTLLTQRQDMKQMRNVLCDESLADKNKLQLFQKQFKSKQEALNQGTTPKLRTLLKVIAERLKAAFTLFNSSLESDIQPAYNDNLVSIERLVETGIKLRT
jgi:hypothetical protein